MGFLTGRPVQGTPAENIRRVEEELLQNQREREDVIQSISACQSQRKKLELCQDRLQQELQKEQAREKILTDGTMIFLEGWVAQTGLSRLEEELSDILCAYEWRDPDPEEIPPTLLKNQKVAFLYQHGDRDVLPAGLPGRN